MLWRRSDLSKVGNSFSTVITLFTSAMFAISIDEIANKSKRSVAYYSDLKENSFVIL